MERQQLEIRFDRAVELRPLSRRQRRLVRAHWWFGQMRKVVNCAFDWKPAASGRAEQTHLGLARGR